MNEPVTWNGLILFIGGLWAILFVAGWISWWLGGRHYKKKREKEEREKRNRESGQ